MWWCMLVEMVGSSVGPILQAFDDRFKPFKFTLGHTLGRGGAAEQEVALNPAAALCQACNAIRQRT